METITKRMTYRVVGTVMHARRSGIRYGITVRDVDTEVLASSTAEAKGKALVQSQGAYWIDFDSALIVSIPDMTFQDAVDVLTEAGRFDDNLVLDARRMVIQDVQPLCTTPTEGLGDWIEAGWFSGDETPASLAAEWDSE